jgi:hypothetical protein
MGKGLALLLLASSLVGCVGEFTAKSRVLEEVDLGIIPKPNDRPECEVQSAEYNLDTKVVAFELGSDTGLTMGYDLLTGFMRAVEVSFRLKTARLSMTMGLQDPMKPGHDLMNVLGKSRLWGLDFKFDLGFNQIGAGFHHYSRTPLAKLSEKGLADSFDNLTDAIEDLQDKWSTQIVAIPNDREMVVPVGSFSGLKEGDQFAIYNTEHVWAGDPCTSEHLLARKTTAAPLAIGTVTQLGKNAALLAIHANDETPILSGAKVEIHKLTEDGRNLLRSVVINTVVGAEIQFENSQKVDIGPYLQDQIRAVAARYGFTVYSH